MEVQQAEFEISYIKKLMEESRRSLAENGTGYIFWGVLVVIGIVFNYLYIVEAVTIKPLFVWAGVVGIGWAVTFWGVKKSLTCPGNRTLLNKILGTVWFSAGVAMTLIGFAGTMSGTLGGYAVLPTICLVLGIAYYVSGTIYGEKWIRFIGLGWWLAATGLFFWRNINSLLIFAGLMIVFQIIPGLYFYKKWKESSANKKEEN